MPAICVGASSLSCIMVAPTMCKIFDSTQLGSAVHSRALEAAHKRAETVRTLSDERLKAARTASQTATYVPPAVSAAPSSSVPPIDDPIMPYSQMKFESDAVRYDPNRPSTSRNDRRSQDAASYHGTPRQSSSGLAPPPSYVARRSQPQLGAGASSSSFVPGHRVKLSAVGVAPSVSSDGSRVSRGSRSSSALSVAQSSYSYAGDGYDSQSDSDSGQDASHSSTQQPRASSSKDKSKRRGDHPKCK